MPRRDPRVDEYIEAAEPFARPILRRLRRDLLSASKELREDIKWGSPHFVRNGIVAGMASFKEHVGFGFWRSKEMRDPENLFQGQAKASMCSLKLATTKDVPDKETLAAYVAEAIALDGEGTDELKRKRAATQAKGKKSIAAKAVPPRDLKDAMQAEPAALSTFEAFPPGKRRDYVEWITEAKRPATRSKRIAQAVQWLAEGKSRHWKYENC